MDSHHCLAAAPPLPCRYTLVAQDLARADHFRVALAALGCEDASTAPVVVVLDVPRGSLAMLSPLDHRPHIVVTDAGSPEYLLDLADVGGALGALPIHNLAALRLLIEQLQVDGHYPGYLDPQFHS